MTIRRFTLVRHDDATGLSGEGEVAWGVEFEDGKVVTRWAGATTEVRQTCVWDSIEHVRAVHGHDGKTEIRYLDDEAGDQLSSWTVNGEQVTWKHQHKQEAERRLKADEWGVLVSDLDRCPHGRHEGDVCSGQSGCNGPSVGNVLLAEGATIGHGLAARPIVVPARKRRHDPTAWRPEG